MNLIRSLITPVVLSICIAAPLTGRAENLEELDRMQVFLDLMQNYFKIIESTHQVASNPEMSAILQMQKMQEIYEQRGEKAKAVGELQKVLKQTDNVTIRNAAYMLMSDTLKETGRSDEAIKLLNQAIAENLRAAN